MAGYTRQATANIQTGKVIYAEDLNAEYNALAAAFSGSSGHTHDGSTGNGPKINLVNSVEGVLPLAMGGTGASNASGARTAIGAHNASNLTTGTLPSGRLSGNYSFGSLTLSGELTADSVTSSSATLGRISLLGNLSKITQDSGQIVDISPAGSVGNAPHLRFFRDSVGGENPIVTFTNGGTTGFWLRMEKGVGVTLQDGVYSGDGSGLTNLNASNITSGTLPANRLPNHSAALLTSGTLPSGRLSGNYSFGSLTLSGNLNLTSGHISGDAAQILTNPGGWTVRTENNSSNYILSVQSSGGAERFKVVHGAPLLKGDSTGWSVDGAFTATTISGTLSGNGSGITNINASNISSGTLNDARIPNLNASKVTAGAFHVDRIPALPASKITSGTFAADRIPSLNASILGSGTVPAARLSGNYSFGSLTLSGTLDTSGNITAPRIRLTSTNDASLSSTDHPFQIGPVSGVNLIIDNNEIMCRDNGAPNTLSINNDGGLVRIGAGGLAVDGNLSVSGTISGNGSGLTNLNASNISSGTLPAARLPNHSAALLTSGTLPSGRLSGNYSFNNLTLSGTLTAASVSGNGSGLTNLNASNISSGTLPAARLPNHSANLLTSGTLPAGRLSGNYSFGSLTLSGSLIAAGGVTAQGNQGAHYGDGTHVTLAPATGNETGRQIHLRPRGSGSLTRELLGTHEGWSIDGNPVATVSTTGSASTTNFPVGHTVLAHKGQYNRNSSQTLRIEGDRYYRVGGSGDALSGTWRARGAAYVHNAEDITVFQRVA